MLLDCKVCHVCNEKGDEARFLLCDCCDRGWHIDCLEPPHELTDMPPEEAKWHCPICPPYIPPEGGDEEEEENSSGESGSDSSDDSSDDSSSDDKDEADVDALISASIETPRKRNRSRPGQPKASTSQAHSNGKTTNKPPRVRDRQRERQRRRERQRPKVKKTSGITLRLLPPRRDEKGMFDDILSKADRDTVQTTIQAGDRTRFERSRSAADVSHHFLLHLALSNFVLQ